MNEFKLFDRIINGDLRPHLKVYDNEEGLKNLEKEIFSTEITVTKDFPDNLLQNFPKFAFGLKDGDEVELILDQEGETPRLTIRGVPNEGKEDLINIDIPPPPDAKSELFLTIITLEFERIKKAITKQFEDAGDQQAISFYATRNIQLAKKIARDAFLLKKKLQHKENDDWDNPNVFIIEAAKKHLVYLITELQILFHPINNSAIQYEGELEDELFEGHHSSLMAKVNSMSREINEKHIEKLYNELGVDPTLHQKRDLFLKKLTEQLGRMKAFQKERGFTNGHDQDMKRLYEKELGKILAELYTQEVFNPAVTGLLEKYEHGLQLITALRLDGHSMEYNALTNTDFFNRIQYQLDTWKELIHLSYSAPVKENICKDLQNTLITIQSRKHLALSEDQWNDYMCDLLRAQKYYIADQSRNGRSGSRNKTKIQSGELDITIRDMANNGNIKTIIETVKISSCGSKDSTIKDHIEKLLTRYDTSGNEESFIVILSYSRQFLKTWNAYKKYVTEIVFQNSNGITDLKTGSGKSDLKVGYSTMDRFGKSIRLYHLFLNMHIG